MCPQTPSGCDADCSQALRIVVCLCRQARLLDADAQRRVVERLERSGLAFELADDLCGLAGRRSPELKRIAGSRGLRIVACYPRAVRWLFHAGGAPLEAEDVQILNIRDPRDEDIQAFCDALPAAAGGKAGSIEAADDDWVPWFPVIDYSRCKGCRKCLGFCLFGVFALDEGERVVVDSPASCKLNCPACARVCPDVAIIFPKYKGPPINGADVTAEDLQREPAQVDVAELARQDVYAALRRRSAGAERLAELQEKLDIPDDVIRSLVGGHKNEPKRE